MGVTLTQEMIEGAQYTETMYGVPASITLGQIKLESGGSYAGGLSGLASNYNNLFGVTAGSSWSGKTIYMTNKQGLDGQIYRVYDSKMDSIIDHALLLNTKRYTQYTDSATTIQEYAQAIKKAGYATDANYVSKLMNTINASNLTQYDNSGLSTKPSGSTGTNEIPYAGTNKDIGASQTGIFDSEKAQDILVNISKFFVIILFIVLGVITLLLSAKESVQ